jgi:hypothetical protein
MNSECLTCHKELPEPKRKYCSRKCQYRWNYDNNPVFRAQYVKNARKQYYKHKDDPEYKAKRYTVTVTWQRIHRDRYNDLMREPNRKRQSFWYHFCKKYGFCAQCHGINFSTNVYCNNCSNKYHRTKIKL